MSGSVQHEGVGMMIMSLVAYCPAASRSLFAIANWPATVATRKHRTDARFPSEELMG